MNMLVLLLLSAVNNCLVIRVVDYLAPTCGCCGPKRMRRYANEMESVRDEMTQRMDKYANEEGQKMDNYANEMESVRDKMTQRMKKYADYMEYLREEVDYIYELPSYSSTSVVYPFEP
jgi:esterase/lipase